MLRLMCRIGMRSVTKLLVAHAPACPESIISLVQAPGTAQLN